MNVWWWIAVVWLALAVVTAAWFAYEMRHAVEVDFEVVEEAHRRDRERRRRRDVRRRVHA